MTKLRQYLIAVQIGDKVETDIMTSEEVLTNADVDQIFERCKNLNKAFTKLFIAYMGDFHMVENGEMFERWVKEDLDDEV